MRPLLCGLLMMFSLAAQAVGYQVVNGDDVNVRKGPGLEWKVVAKADKDQLVLETRREGQWSEVFYLTPRKKTVAGWIFNTYLQPQVIQNQPLTQDFDVKAAADQLICTDNAAIVIGSLCYLDVHFTVAAKDISRRDAKITCWADFVVPGDRKVKPIQTTDTQSYHLFSGKAEGVMRLKVGLDEKVSARQESLAYFNCSAK